MNILDLNLISTKIIRSVTDTTPHEQRVNSPTRKFSRRTYTAKAYETEQGSQGSDVLAQDSLTVFGTQAGTHISLKKIKPSVGQHQVGEF